MGNWDFSKPRHKGDIEGKYWSTSRGEMYNTVRSLQLHAVLYLISVDQLSIPLLNVVPRLAAELISSNTKKQSSKIMELGMKDGSQ